jgi:hypothetical protein
MKKRYIMPILMYELHPEDKIGKYNPDTIYENEVMDGQHRLYTLNSFKSAAKQKLPSVSKPFIVHWILEVEDEEGHKHNKYIFYERTGDVDSWCKENKICPDYLSPEGKKVFNKTVIKITSILSKMAMDERRAEFLSLQNGIPVRGSDLIKNEVGCKLMVEFNIHNYEEKMMNILFIHCSKKAEKFWTSWAAKFYQLYKTKDPSLTFVRGDKEIEKLIKNRDDSLDPSNDFKDFDDKFLDFIKFLKELNENVGENVVMNPTQIFALFYHMCHDPYNREILYSHMSNFSKEGQVRKFKNLWEKDDKKQRKEYFNDCLSRLRGMTEKAKPYDDRKITQKLRNDVWKEYFDDDTEGKCTICDKNITKNDFECGHIQSRALGGETALYNLKPMCRDCNRKMGTKNALDFKRDNYPSI